jgi:hypothetical protein
MKIYIFSVLMLFVTISTSAQTPEEILQGNLPTTFIGLDFSECKGVLLGCTSAEIVENHIPAINKLLIDQPNKFDLNKSFTKTKIITDISETNKVNSTINSDSFQVASINKIKPLDENKLSEMIKKYDLLSKNGVGLVYIVESLDKTKNIATYHLVFFSIPDRKIIMNQKYESKAGGFGIRNFWAGSFYSIIKFNASYPLRMKYLK